MNIEIRGKQKIKRIKSVRFEKNGFKFQILAESERTDQFE